jgi:hypothetical protein
MTTVKATVAFQPGEHIAGEVPLGLSAQIETGDSQPFHLAGPDLQPASHVLACEDRVRRRRESHT